MEAYVRKHPGPGGWKRILGVLLVLALLAAGAVVVLFQVNRYTLTVQLQGEAEITLEYGETYQEAGAAAVLTGTLFSKEGKTPEDLQIQVDGEVNADKLGKYTLTYTASYRDWTATAQRIVRVVDTQSPVITLVDSGKEHLPGTPYEEEGFTAVDNYDGDITDRVIRTESLGLITYTVLDSSGNPAYVEREVRYFDPLPPEITLEGGDYIAINVGTAYTEPGFQAQDNADGDMTEQVFVEGVVDCFRPGKYPVTYSVTDSYDNHTTVTRLVEVVAQPRPQIVTPQDKVIYLTFDDGPGPYTDELLDVLASYGVKATFFVTDSGFYEEMRRIVDEGHSIGIHTVSHEYADIYSSPEAYFADLHRMQDIIYEQTGVKTTLMRFPGGSSNTVSSKLYPGLMTLLSEAVQDAGFQYFDWNVDSNDAGGARKAQTVLENVKNGVSQCRVSIVLQHDIHGYSVEAVEDIIIWGLNNGYTFQALQPNSPNAHHGVRN